MKTLLQTSLTSAAILLLAVAPSRAAKVPRYDSTIGSSAVPGLQNPQAVAVDRDGNVYVADTGNHRVVKFSRTGGFLLQWGTEGSARGQFVAPCSIATDSSNNVYVADSGNEWVQKFTSNGAYLTGWYCPHPTAVAVDRDDSVYVADRGVESLEFNHWGGGWIIVSVPGVRKFSGSGTLQRQWPINTAPFSQYIGLGFSGTYYTGGLAVAPNGDIWVAYSYHYTGSFEGSLENWRGAGLELFASDGVYVADLGTRPAPDAIALDNANTVYWPDRSNNRIDMLAADGAFTEWAASGVSSFSGPRGVAVDRSGNFLYVADSGNNRIVVFAHQPTLSTRATGTNSMVLSWSAAAVGYRLQSTVNLTPPVTWIDVTNSPSVIGGRFTVTNPMTRPAQFFRLKRP